MRFLFELFYHLGISVYHFIISFASLFNPKAKLFTLGRKEIWSHIPKIKEKVIWFHCSSLGEYEQGKSLIEKFKKEWPEKKILLTFFSPSGYEIVKGKSIADYIFYLPKDSSRNAKKWFRLWEIEKVFFIKYDIWYFFLKTAIESKTPTYIISANFSPSHYFFKWYGKPVLEVLKKIDHIFLQNDEYWEFLSQNLNAISVAGDTRIDSILEQANNRMSIEVVENFCNQNTLVFGSIYPEDEKIIDELIKNDDMKIILAPHELSASYLSYLQHKYNACVYSHFMDEKKSNVLLLDQIGLLKHAYAYSQIAYIGGGYGKGIHNTLEPAVYGNTLCFGPNYNKFPEAKTFIKSKIAYSANESSRIAKFISDTIFNKETLEENKKTLAAYFEKNKGATEKIMEYLKK